MAIRLTLLCHGATRTLRQGGFASAEEPLDDGGARKAADARLDRTSHAVAMTSPAMAARQTAEALGLVPSVDARLCDGDMGQWVGLSFEDVQAQDPAGFAAWLAHPEEGVPGGESLKAVRARIADWIAEQTDRGQDIIAVTHPMVVRAALSACLDIPLVSVLRFDMAPLCATTLSHHRLWRLQAIEPLGSRRDR